MVDLDEAVVAVAVVAASEVVVEAVASEEAVVVIGEEEVAVAATQTAEGVTGLAQTRKSIACICELAKIERITFHDLVKYNSSNIIMQRSEMT